MSNVSDKPAHMPRKIVSALGTIDPTLLKNTSGAYDIALGTLEINAVYKLIKRKES